MVRRAFGKLAAWLKYYRDYKSFRSFSSSQPPRFSVRWRDRYPCLDDRTVATGFDRHYVYHVAWAARILSRLRPKLHVDVGSCLYFCSTVSAFLPVEFLDYRPADLRLDGLASRAGDLMQLPFAAGSVASISCMHVVEHLGLGRYGDPLDLDGDLKAIAELKRVVAPGGMLLFVVPVGQPRICFNAHRIYGWNQVFSYFDSFELAECALIPENGADGGLITAPPADLLARQSYGCGCFAFRRPE